MVFNNSSLIMSMSNFNLIQYKFYGHEKTHVNSFSYPCWWVGKRSEVVIKMEVVTRKGGK
jgi:hypothetical protein